MRSSRAAAVAGVVTAFLLLIASRPDAWADPVHVREAGPADAFLCCNGFYSFLFDGDAALATTGRAGIFRSDHRGQHWQRSMQGFVAQAAQALRNVVAVLREGGAEPAHVVRMTWYVVDKGEYLASLPALGAAYRAVMGAHYPAMTAVKVSALIEDRAKVEIEATAVVPDGGVR